MGDTGHARHGDDGIRRARTGVVMMAAFAVVVSLITTPTAAEAAPLPRTATISAATSMTVGALVTVSGAVTRSPRATPVKVQYRAASGWRTLATAYTTSTGKYSVKVEVPRITTLKLRALAPAVKPKSSVPALRNGLAQAVSRTHTASTRTWEKLADDDGGWVSCGIKSDTSLWCWGLYVGDGKTSMRYKPARVAGQWSSVEVGSFGVCAIKTTGSLWCWGEMDRLGDGKERSRVQTTPVQVAGRWSSVSVGGSHTCGIQKGGSLWCWGYRGNQDQTCDTSLNLLGDGAWVPTTEPSTAFDTCGSDHALPKGDVPRRVGTESWRRVSTGDAHTCAIRSDGSAWCWGVNTPYAGTGGTGVLGDGTKKAAPAPVRVASSRTWTQLDADASHTCGIASTGKAYCWGSNSNGQLGDGTRTARLKPTAVATSSTWRRLAVGSSATCAVREDRSGWCWGSTVFGQLADNTGWGTADDREKVKFRTRPVRMSGGGRWLSIESPGLGLTTDRKLWRWGAIDTEIRIGGGSIGGSYRVMAVPQRWMV
jgi:alpha-tubulin suppressor-like RCC1 family protein